MPTRTKAAKKKVMKTKKVTAKKPSKKLTPGKVILKVKKKVLIKTLKKSTVPKFIGEVVHYYDRIGVAIIELKMPLAVGDAILMKRGVMELFEQRIDSMQIDHTPVTKAKKGDVVGIKVRLAVADGTIVLPA
jgi:putative protease